MGQGRRLLVTCLIAAAVCMGTDGAPPRAAQAPQRIISLVPAVTEMLFAIGAGPRVVAVSSYDTFPPEVTPLPRVGALLDPDVERLLSLRPDLVAVYSSQMDLKGQLDRAGIDAFDYRHGGLADVMATIRRLGMRTGLSARGDEVARGLEARLANVRRRTAGRPRPRTLLVFGREADSLRNLYASGGRGFLHDMLEAAGGVNVFADVAQEAVQASTELVLARAPEVILELHDGPRFSESQVAATLALWQRLPAVPAVSDKRVTVISGDGLVVPGPRVAAAAEQLARALQPGAFTP
jgi:iron complex transport system substrate-binding protein